MSSISSFKAYYKRKYRINGVAYEEGERQMAQLKNSEARNLEDQSNLYLGQTAAFSPSLTDVHLPTFLGPNQYGAYSPGLVFLPKQYYTLKDFLPSQWYGTFNEESFSTLYDLFKLMVKKSFTLNDVGDHRFCYSYANPEVWFWDDEENNMRAFWTVAYVGTQRRPHENAQSYIIQPGFYFFLQPISYETPISTMEFKEIPSYGASWVANTPDGQVDIAHSNGKYGWDKAWGWNITVGGLSEYTSENILANLLTVCKFLEGNRYYPCVQATTDTRDVEPSFNGLMPFRVLRTNQTILKQGINLLCDVSYSSLFPSNGFFCNWHGFAYENPGIYRIDWKNGGPSANNPDYREDDPNDDDPGKGPGDTDGDIGGDGDHDNTSDKIVPPGIPTLSGAQAGLFTIFSPSVSQLSELGSQLWNPDALQALKQYFSSPLDAVLGLSIVPVTPATAADREILLGIYKTGVSAPVVTSDYVVVDCGSIPITRYYGSYLDYSPYTRINCYLPYIGEVDIDPDECMQKTLNVRYYINVVTGDTVAMIFFDGDLFYTATGNCARQLPLSSADYSSIINTAVSAVSTTIMAASTAGVGSTSVAASQSAKGATDTSKELASKRASANNVGSATSLIGDVMNAKMRYNHVGTLGTGAGQLARQKPYLIIERPNLNLADNYKSFVGYPCNKTKALSSCKGFTQVESTNIAVRDCTDVELAMIKELLMEGVIF